MAAFCLFHIRSWKVPPRVARHNRLSVTETARTKPNIEAENNAMHATDTTSSQTSMSILSMSCVHLLNVLQYSPSRIGTRQATPRRSPSKCFGSTKQLCLSTPVTTGNFWRCRPHRTSRAWTRSLMGTRSSCCCCCCCCCCIEVIEVQ